MISTTLSNQPMILVVKVKGACKLCWGRFTTIASIALLLLLSASERRFLIPFSTGRAFHSLL